MTALQLGRDAALIIKDEAAFESRIIETKIFVRFISMMRERGTGGEAMPIFLEEKELAEKTRPIGAGVKIHGFFDGLSELFAAREAERARLLGKLDDEALGEREREDRLPARIERLRPIDEAAFRAWLKRIAELIRRIKASALTLKLQ